MLVERVKSLQGDAPADFASPLSEAWSARRPRLRFKAARNYEHGGPTYLSDLRQ
jgi:hypothetical protein